MVDSSYTRSRVPPIHVRSGTGYLRHMNPTCAAYHLATLADFSDSGVIFARPHVPGVSLSAAKAVGASRVVGAARAVANAIRRAAGKRVRARPATPISRDKLPI